MEYEFIVIGAGSAGVRAARLAAQMGKKVAIVDYQALGGTCVNVGCIPKKLFVYASQFPEYLDYASSFGWETGSNNFDWRVLLANKDLEIQRLNGIYENMLLKAGVNIIKGKARFVNEREIEVSGDHYTAKNIVVATGSKAFVPDFEGKEFVKTSDDMFFLDHLPKSILVVGGGYIALEFAGIMNGLGVKTELSYRGDLPLRGFDSGMRRHLIREIAKHGINFRFHNEVEKIEKVEEGLLVSCNENDACLYDEVLFATGRTPNTESLELRNAGLEMNERGAIVVDENFKTNVPGVFAIGDVIDRMQLTPVALREATVLVNQLFGDSSQTMNYELVPSAVFSQPSFACVGFSEEQALEKSTKEGFEIEIYESDFRALKHSLSTHSARTYMKLIVNKNNQKVLGVHMVGDDAAEIIQGLAIALSAGATKQDFDQTIGIHPSSAEEFVTMRTARS